MALAIYCSHKVPNTPPEVRHLNISQNITVRRLGLENFKSLLKEIKAI